MLTLSLAADSKSPSWVIVLGAGLVGILVGHLLRGAEFRREQRLKAYSEFLQTLDREVSARDMYGHGQAWLYVKNASLLPDLQLPMPSEFGTMVTLVELVGELRAATYRVDLLASPKAARAANQLAVFATDPERGLRLSGALNITERSARMNEYHALVRDFVKASRSDVNGWFVNRARWIRRKVGRKSSDGSGSPAIEEYP